MNNEVAAPKTSQPPNQGIEPVTVVPGFLQPVVEHSNDARLKENDYRQEERDGDQSRQPYLDGRKCFQRPFHATAGSVQAGIPPHPATPDQRVCWKQRPWRMPADTTLPISPARVFGSAVVLPGLSCHPYWASGRTRSMGELPHMQREETEKKLLKRLMLIMLLVH